MFQNNLLTIQNRPLVHSFWQKAAALVTSPEAAGVVVATLGGAVMGSQCVNPEVATPFVAIGAFVLSSMVGWAGPKQTEDTLDEMLTWDDRPVSAKLFCKIVDKEKKTTAEENDGDVRHYAKKLCSKTKLRLVVLPTLSLFAGAYLSDVVRHPENIARAIGGVTVVTPILTRLFADYRFGRKLLKNEWIARDPLAQCPPVRTVTALDHA